MSNMEDNEKPLTPLHQYVASLFKLHKEMEKGKSEGVEAELLREQMDEPWYNLTNDDRKLIIFISEELYNFSPKPSK